MLYPHGHPRFNELMIEMMRLHSDKNKGYAEGGSPLGNFERSAAIMHLYPSFPNGHPAAIAMMFVLKHFDRVMWDLSIGREPSDEALADISVYMTIIRCIILDRNVNKPISS